MMRQLNVLRDVRGSTFHLQLKHFVCDPMAP